MCNVLSLYTRVSCTCSLNTNSHFNQHGALFLLQMALNMLIMYVRIIACTLCLQVTPPESMKPRHFHSITATSLGPGLTEVLVFGGLRKVGGDAIAETTILRFGEQLLVHVAMTTIV